MNITTDLMMFSAIRRNAKRRAPLLEPLRISPTKSVAVTKIDDFSKVYPWLYVGRRNVIDDVFFDERGVRHMISVGEPPRVRRKDIITLVIRIPCETEFQKTYQFLSTVQKDGHKVVVVCHSSEQIYSGWIVLDFHMRTTELSFEDARRHLKDRRVGWHLTLPPGYEGVFNGYVHCTMCGKRIKPNVVQCHMDTHIKKRAQRDGGILEMPPSHLPSKERPPWFDTLVTDINDARDRHTG